MADQPATHALELRDLRKSFGKTEIIRGATARRLVSRSSSCSSSSSGSEKSWTYFSRASIYS